MYLWYFLFVFIYPTQAQDDLRNWETIPVIPYVSGLRIEDIGNVKGFLGYKNRDSVIVEPDVKVAVVIFGYWLDKIEYVTFTDSVCITSEFNISNAEFHMQTETKVVFELAFPSWDSPWRLCVKQKGPTGELLQIDDDRTWVTTAVTIKEYYMPVYLQVVVILVLFSLSALFSGLNLGLMSLSIQELQLIQKSGTKTEARYAKRILPVREKGNYLLCTILLMNVVVNSSVAILFEDLLSGFLAFTISSFGIVVFGEIIPQSVCVRYGLAVGARTIILTRLFMIITFPLSYPISKILDRLLGEDVVRIDRSRLVEILKMTRDDENQDLSADLKIAVGAMEFAKKFAGDIMTRIDDVYMLPEERLLDGETLAEIVKSGYTRIPIYKNGNRNDVKSLLMVKDLALIDKKNNIRVKTVSEFHKHRLRIVDEETPLPDLLEEFKTGDYHLAMVSKSKTKGVRESTFLEKNIAELIRHNIAYTMLEKQKNLPSICVNGNGENSEDLPTLIGVITLEDILEEILQSEILDESDSVMDNVNRFKRQFSQNRVSEMFCCENRSDPLSYNMRMVVIKWLSDHCVLFNDEHLDHGAREKMIQTNVRQVVLVTQKNEATNNIVYLYQSGTPSKRFILLLEGKAVAKFAKSQMIFDVGPWTCFGDVLLKKLLTIINNNQSDVPHNIYFIPDFDLTVSEPCRFLQIPICHLINALRVSQFIKQLTVPNSLNNSDDEEDNIPIFFGKKKLSFRSRMRQSTLSPESELKEPLRARSYSSVSSALINSGMLAVPSEAF